jgi:hypothetical protein
LLGEGLNSAEIVPLIVIQGLSQAEPIIEMLFA